MATPTDHNLRRRSSSQGPRAHLLPLEEEFVRGGGGKARSRSAGPKKRRGGAHEEAAVWSGEAEDEGEEVAAPRTPAPRHRTTHGRGRASSLARPRPWVVLALSLVLAVVASLLALSYGLYRLSKDARAKTPATALRLFAAHAKFMLPAFSHGLAASFLVAAWVMHREPRPAVAAAWVAAHLLLGSPAIGCVQVLCCMQPGMTDACHQRIRHPRSSQRT